MKLKKAIALVSFIMAYTLGWLALDSPFLLSLYTIGSFFYLLSYNTVIADLSATLLLILFILGFLLSNEYFLAVLAAVVSLLFASWSISRLSLFLLKNKSITKRLYSLLR
ncbi:MAG: hypothetical protein D6687_00020 [Acidobacteria bacterium]|nr:MAG: hypothetical protein D6687_00020 [Acidobacteriota bacterium]